jgi:prepilin-type processing-associated H-X9-DG protein
MTIAVVEAARPVPWTKPEDIPFDPSRPVPKLGGLFPEGFNALFADGHVSFIPKSVKLDDLKPLITRNARDRLRIDLDY